MAFGQITAFKIIIVRNDSRLTLGPNYINGMKTFKNVKVQIPRLIIDRIKRTLRMNYLHSELERVCAHSAGLRSVQSSDIWRGLKLENLTILRC